MEQNIAHDLEAKSRTEDVLTKGSFNFSSLLLSNSVLEGLQDSGFYKPSPIQLKAIPLGKCGLDLIIKAKSGTGKTAVFAIIALEMVKTSKNVVQVLIFAPTREIAVQIKDVIKTIGKNVIGLKVGSFIGGLPVEEDIKQLKHCHIAVGAPGRLKYLIENNHLVTNSIKLVVLDEVDKLMEQSFQSDINFVYNKLPQYKQFLAVSATYPDELATFLANYMHSPTFVTPESENQILLGLRQFVSIVKAHKHVNRQITIKNEELVRLLSIISFTQCLIFFNTKERTEGICCTLNAQGWNASAISANHSQAKRLKVVDDFKNCQSRILLSTDLTARGIDVANVDLVINYEVPYETATYLHRIGRAGRYGSKGLCVSIVANESELSLFQNILGEIGGPELSVSKIPGGNEVALDLWKAELSSFENIYGTINTTNSNVNDSMIMSVFKMKGDRGKTVSETVNQDCSTCDTQTQIDGIHNTLNNEMVDELSEGLDTESILNKLALGESIEIINSAIEITEDPQTEDLINPASLYPWISVENGPLLRDSPGVNLLDLSDEKMHNDQTSNSKEAKNAVLLKNIALYNVSKLLTNSNNCTADLDNISGCINNYLEVLNKDEKLEKDAMVKHFDSCSTNSLLENIGQHTKEWTSCHQALKSVQTSALENIFKLGYCYMIKNANHWMDELGDEYEPEEEADEEMDCEEEEVHQENNYYYNNWSANHESNFENNSHFPGPSNETNFNQAQTGVGDWQHTYDGYFAYYGQMLATNIGNFHDVDSFDRYFAHWQSQIQQVRDYVQQNIYLQEMNHHLYQRSQGHSS